MVTEIKLLPCPFCGEVPTLTKKQMWQGSHGYYGCYGFSVKCENEDCAITPFTRTFDTIYEKDENKQKKKAIAAWNRRAEQNNTPLALDEIISRCTPKAAELLKNGLFGAVKVCAVEKTTPKTNADRIRSMSDEELAEYIFDLGNGPEYCDGHCAYQDDCNAEGFNYNTCIKGVTDWLKQPAKEEHHEDD